jgi:hypothetical protein
LHSYLESERKSVIEERLRQVNDVPELTSIVLSDAERTGHLPILFDQLISRLRLGGSAQPSICTGAGAHGKLRSAQGYSVSMLVEESRLFEVFAFRTLHLHRSDLIQSETAVRRDDHCG